MVRLLTFWRGLAGEPDSDKSYIEYLRQKDEITLIGDHIELSWRRAMVRRELYYRSLALLCRTSHREYMRLQRLR